MGRLAVMDRDPLVRRASPDDAASIAALYADFLRTYGHEAEPAPILRFLIRMLAAEWTRFFVAVNAYGTFMGFAGCVLSYSAVDQSGALVINDFYVDVPFRRLGVGLKLCRAVERCAVELGATRIFLAADPDMEAALSLYRKAGFEVMPYRSMTRVLPDARDR